MQGMVESGARYHEVSRSQSGKERKWAAWEGTPVLSGSKEAKNPRLLPAHNVVFHVPSRQSQPSGPCHLKQQIARGL